MKTFSLSSTPARPQRLWQVAGLNNADSVALLGQINEGLDGIPDIFLRSFWVILAQSVIRFATFPSRPSLI